jgi:hypothetical protein
VLQALFWGLVQFATCEAIKVRDAGDAYFQVTCFDANGEQVGEPHTVHPLPFGEPS